MHESFWNFSTMRGRAGRSCIPVVLACGVALSLFAQAASAQVSYQYKGKPFTFFSCGGNSACTTPGPNANTSYTASDFVTATLTVNAPLPVSQTFLDATTLPGFKLTMNDGQQTVSSPGGVIAMISTDAAGDIIAPWAVFINTGGFDNGGVATLNDPGGRGVADQGVLDCCYPPSTGNVGVDNLAINFGEPQTWSAVSSAGLSFGTFTRVNQFDSFDNADQIKGGLGVSHTWDGAGSIYGSNTAQAGFVPLTLMTPGGPVTVNGGPAAGAWSDSNLGDGSAIGLAFATFNGPPNGVTFRVNAVLDGEFVHDVFGLPDGNLAVGAQVLIVDTAKFGAALTAPGVNPGQFLTGGPPSTNAIDPGAAIAHLDAAAAGTVLGSANYGQNQSSAQFNTLLTIPLNTGFVTIPAGKQFTLIFEVAAESLVGGFVGYSAGTGEVNFLSTLQPAANLFTDVNGNPVVGITAAGSSPVASPTPGAITLSTPTPANVVGATETMTATVTDTTTAVLPGATVMFHVISGPNAGVTGVGITGANGQASLSYMGNGGAGTDSIQASVGTLVSNVIQETWAFPRIRLQVSPNVVTYPNGANVSVCVTPETNASATGSVQVLDGMTLLTTLALQGNGCASWYISPGLKAGAHLLTAVYSGDANNPPGKSPVAPLLVNPVQTYLTASCGGTSFVYGGNYTCNVNVGSTAGGAQGVITYTFDNGAPVIVPLSGGFVQFSLARPGVGSHTVAIGYAQQGNFLASGPITENFTVTPAP